MKISIVIPNYNGLALLKKNVPLLLAVLKNDGVITEIIIVDDASEDDSVSWLTTFVSEHKDKQIEFNIIQNEVNKGFSYTVNKGASVAIGEFIVFLNTDVYPKKGFIEYSIKHFINPHVCAVGFMDESMEDGKIVLRGSGIGMWQKGFYLHKKGEVTTNYTDWVSGGSSIFRKDIFKKLGGFDTVYGPFYWEDIDLSYRAKKNGYQIVFEPKSVVVHEHEKGAILSKYSKEDVMRISYRNQFIFVWNNASPVQLLVHIIWLPYHLMLSVKGDRKLLGGFFQALVRFFHFKLLHQ